MNPDDLVAIARELVRREPGRPKQTSLKRGVSTAYYALFHALAQECIALTVTWGFRSPRYWETVGPIYRAMDHGAAKALFTRLSGDRDAVPALKQIAHAFVELQAERILADYHPKPRLTRSNADFRVKQAEDAIIVLRALADDTKRELAALLIARQR